MYDLFVLLDIMGSMGNSEPFADVLSRDDFDIQIIALRKHASYSSKINV